MKSWWVLALFAATLARADDLVTIESGYRVRRGHGYKYGWDLVVRRPTKARIMATKGPWRKVCIGGSLDECAGGRSGWVYKDGVHSSSTEASRTAGRCASGRCGPKRPRSEENIEEIANAIGDRFQYKDLPRGFGPLCSDFISSRGLGHWGVLMTKTAQLKAKDCFYDTDIFDNLCPNYLAMPMGKKDAFLALVFASIGQQEARGCNPRAVNPEAENDQGDGMFMMEHTASQRRGAGRNPTLCETNNVNAATFSPVFQANCTISIINDTICHGRYRKSIHRYPQNYFAELKGEGIITRRIRSTARAWNLCR